MRMRHVLIQDGPFRVPQALEMTRSISTLSARRVLGSCPAGANPSAFPSRSFSRRAGDPRVKSTEPTPAGQLPATLRNGAGKDLANVPSAG